MYTLDSVKIISLITTDIEPIKVVLGNLYINVDTYNTKCKVCKEIHLDYKEQNIFYNLGNFNDHFLFEIF